MAAVDGTARGTARSLADALALVAEIPDYPVPGVVFRDLNPVVGDARAFATVIDALAERVPAGTTTLAAVEARGFLFAAAVGYSRGLGVVPVRKPGKLPAVAERVEYTLEYGKTALELPAGAVDHSRSVYVIDDVLATGGTVAAACGLVEAAGGVVTGVGVVLEIAGLAGRHSLVRRDLSVLASVG